MTILHKIISSTGIMTVTKVKNIKNRARPRGQSTCAFFLHSLFKKNSDSRLSKSNNPVKHYIEFCLINNVPLSFFCPNLISKRKSRILKRCVYFLNFLGSMSGTPMEVAVALSLLLCEAIPKVII